ncbi:MAG: DUF2237 domain-containing protein [Planctomycetota bacterium]|nr:DUF2237 domain-containing protein [Planctomycetota bacterium]MEC9234562.1 DUF2237 domain-containing protein [Planctomycetota bacterium]MED6307444.1 DUF2237 domain-containing protein [Planctomycetota bacterium]
MISTDAKTEPGPRNVLGGRLAPCSLDPLTGFFRTGCCETGPEDGGRHVICVRVSAEFLAFSQAVGNDLSTPMPQYGFEGLRDGDQWCLCADRWVQALAAGCAPPVVLEATEASALEVASLADLQAHALES